MLLILLVGLVVLLACLYVLVVWVAPLLLFLIDPLSGGTSSGVGSGWLGAGTFADLGMYLVAVAIVLVAGHLVLRGGSSSGAMQRR